MKLTPLQYKILKSVESSSVLYRDLYRRFYNSPLPIFELEDAGYLKKIASADGLLEEITFTGRMALASYGFKS
jgi:hypothetical protein